MTLMRKGEALEYQHMIEGTIGDFMSKLSCYSHKDGDDRAFFLPDCDYEIIIRPKK